jgi:hypothetical protein
MRTFICSLYHGENNSVHTVETINGLTPFDAFNAFCFQLGATGYPLRKEQPESNEGKLFSVWSAGCSISGQRIYIKEQISGFA